MGLRFVQQQDAAGCVGVWGVAYGIPMVTWPRAPAPFSLGDRVLGDLNGGWARNCAPLQATGDTPDILGHIVLRSLAALVPAGPFPW